MIFYDVCLHIYRKMRKLYTVSFWKFQTNLHVSFKNLEFRLFECFHLVTVYNRLQISMFKSPTWYRPTKIVSIVINILFLAWKLNFRAIKWFFLQDDKVVDLLSTFRSLPRFPTFFPKKLRFIDENKWKVKSITQEVHDG